MSKAGSVAQPKLSAFFTPHRGEKAPKIRVEEQPAVCDASLDEQPRLGTARENMLQNLRFDAEAAPVASESSARRETVRNILVGKRARSIGDIGTSDDEQGDADAAASSSRKTAKPAAPTKYTPLEKQIIALKEKYHNIMLVFEVSTGRTAYLTPGGLQDEVLRRGCTRREPAARHRTSNLACGH